MTDSRQRQPASDEAPHTIPENAAVLAPPRQRAMPRPADSVSKKRQRRLVHGHSVVAKVSTHNRPQPLALLGDRFVPASLKLGFPLIQLRLQPRAYRLPQHREPSIALLLHADVRKAEKVERLRFPFSPPLPLVDRLRTELEQSRFLRVQLQIKLPHSRSEFRPELIGIRFAVEAHHESSSGGELHPSALTEPDVKLSLHPALTIQPPASRPAPSEQTACGPAVQCVLASTSTRVPGTGTFCISAAPKQRGPH
jgi:hypothetical protein